MTPESLFEIIHRHIGVIQKRKARPTRVAVNGVEGVGKTVFAERLTRFLAAQGMNAIHVSIDGFHFHKARRYRQGRDSARGYYEDAYDEVAFVEKVLLASQADTPSYVPAIHDLEKDELISVEPIPLSRDSVMVTDGAYLFKPNYRDHWDLKIYLRTDFDTARSRGAARDAPLLGGMEATLEKYAKRYHWASRLYIEENNPEQLADLVIDNTDLAEPRLCREPG